MSQYLTTFSHSCVYTQTKCAYHESRWHTQKTFAKWFDIFSLVWWNKMCSFAVCFLQTRIASTSLATYLSFVDFTIFVYKRYMQVNPRRFFLSNLLYEDLLNPEYWKKTDLSSCPSLCIYFIYKRWSNRTISFIISLYSSYYAFSLIVVTP